MGSTTFLPNIIILITISQVLLYHFRIFFLNEVSLCCPGWSWTPRLLDSSVLPDSAGITDACYQAQFPIISSGYIIKL